MEGLVRCSANYVPLTPISFLERSAAVYGERASVVYGAVRFTWRETLQRCKRLASALSLLGISCGDVPLSGGGGSKNSTSPEYNLVKCSKWFVAVSYDGDGFTVLRLVIAASFGRATKYAFAYLPEKVAALIPNIPAMYELHFGAPMAGAVLCTLNIRHDSAMLAVLLRHSVAKVIVVDCQFLDTILGALKIMSMTGTKLPLIIVVLDQQWMEASKSCTENLEEYESLLERGTPDFEVRRPEDEWDPITLNYTSGTTSNPKGVVYSHRGAYLNSLASVLMNSIGTLPVYLWTVPMFHCNGWCFTWAVAAQGGTNVCLRAVSAEGIFSAIAEHNVTHMSGAPTVMNMIINATASERKPLPGKVEVVTGGAPPPPQVIFKMEKLGFGVTHGYGLTETYGPATVCFWKPEWDALPADVRAKLKARQGVHHLGLEEVDVRDPVTMKSVPPDAKTIGEVMIRGNTVMNGYLKDPEATKKALEGGWFHTGDLGVKNPDGYVELKDRSKDIIISGGENISSIEVEAVLFSHPSVLEAAVVGRPDDHWGETPCAFVTLKNGHKVSPEEMIKFCRDRLPHYMAPRTVLFEDLPKTSTGKTQKFVLREKAKAMGSLPTRTASKL